MSWARIPSFASRSALMASLHGSAPKKPTRRGRERMSIPMSRACSARNIAYEGVQARAVDPKSCMI